MKETVSIVGLGWFGMELAHSLHSEYIVQGTKRALPIGDHPFSIFELDFEKQVNLESLSKALNADHIVLNIPPNSRSENAQEKYRFLMSEILECLSYGRLKKLIFVSSTGVFGNNEGELDESTIPMPNTVGGIILREAEERVLSLSKTQGIVLRPSGLVGGDRHPVKFLAGRNGVKGRLHPVNLVHREDLITTTRAILQTDHLASNVFHATCGVHPLKEEYYRTEAKKRGLTIPEFDQSDNTLGKKVLASKSKELLGVSFTYENPYKMP